MTDDSHGDDSHGANSNKSDALADAADDPQEAHIQAHCEVALVTIKDIMLRFDEACDGSYSMYDLLGYLVGDLVKEGACAACLAETLDAAFKDSGANTSEHIEDDQKNVLH